MWSWFKQALAELDSEAAQARAALGQSERGRDLALGREAWRVRQILIVGAALLLLGFSYGDKPYFDNEILPALMPHLAARGRWFFSKYRELSSYSYWAVAKLLGFGLLPLLHLRLLGEPIADYGLRWPRHAERLPFRHTYLVCFLALFPVLVALSYSPSFTATYPFYREASRSGFDLVSWELQYAATFVAIEFFFRGYLLFGLFRALGSHAIFVSAVPYALIHINKPASEALGSIFAGILLGTLALRTRSLWAGAALHIAIALSMDFLSLWRSVPRP